MAESKGRTVYEVMHLEKPVAVVSSIGTASIMERCFMPYDLYLEDAGDTSDIDTLINNLDNFYHWCASRVLSLDRKYAKEILGCIGASQAVTDRDRAAISLYPLMDFNQSFHAYDDLEGSMCQTAFPEKISQREAAVRAVRHIGLRMITEPSPNLFGNMRKEAAMFEKRLDVLESAVR